MSAVTTWSLTPSDNNSAPPNGWPEGQAAASVNNCARQMMADTAREFQVNAVKVLASVAGTNTITGSMSPDLTSYSGGMLIVFVPANTNTGAATINIDSLGAKAIQKNDGDALVAGDLVIGIPAVLVMYSDLTGFILLNPQTYNGVGLTLSGNASIGGTLSVTGAVTLNGALTTDNTTVDEAGFKGIPLTDKSTSYGFVLADAGKGVNAIVNGITITIPANASVAYPIGTVLTVSNRSGGNVTIAITTDTMILSGTATTGSRTLAANGIATALKVEAATWLISGTGLS